MSRTTTEAINSYLTDMLALEEHIAIAVRAQAKDLHDEPRIMTKVLEATATSVEAHVGALKQVIAERETGAAHTVAEALKRAASVLSGAGAVAVDLVRNEKPHQDLRDDYTAFSLAIVSYVMLLITAMSLNDQVVAELAQRHLRDYTKVVMKVNNVLPSEVITRLREEGLPAREEQLPAIARTLNGVWSDPYHAVAEVDEVSVG